MNGVVQIFNKQSGNNMKKVDKREMTARLNQFRLSHLGKSFTRQEMENYLGQMGFNSGVIKLLLPKLPYEMVGQAKLFNMDSNPIHISTIDGCYRKCASYAKKTVAKKHGQCSEEQAIQTLKNAGYKIQREVGFDMERFKKELLHVYQRYLKYETV
jgi:hypothetical protein